MEKYRVYAGIDLDAVRYNMESMHKNINKDTKMIAVSKRMDTDTVQCVFPVKWKTFRICGDTLWQRLTRQRN